MRLTRILAGALSAALLGLVPVALASAPAQAATPVVVTLTPQYKQVVYGTKSDFAVTVGTSAGAPVSTGIVKLQSQIRGQKWKTVRQATPSTSLRIYDVKPAEHTNYRVVYSDSSGAYSTATSGTVRIKVARKITSSAKGWVLKGKVTPKFGKKKIVVMVSKREKRGFKKLKTVRTNKKGQYRVSIPSRRGKFFYRLQVPGDKRFLKNAYGWEITGF